MHDNPYQALLLDVAGITAAWDPATVVNRERPKRFSQWTARNEWVYTEMANVLLAKAYARAHRLGDDGGRTVPRASCAPYFEALLDAAVDDRWFHRGEGMGDENIDRFTLLPLLEAYLRVAEDLTGALRDRFIAKVRAVLEVQYREYGSGSPQILSRGPYPNMDVYYGLIMLHGHRLTGDERFRAEFEKFLGILADAQFEDGGWTYIRGTNECPVYHNVNLLLMARIHELSRAPSARAQIEKSVPYYPLIVAPNGRAEFHTDCWWKHGWSEQTSYAPDTVAALTGDGANRWVGDRTRSLTVMELRDRYARQGPAIADNGQVLQAYYAARYWRPVKSEPPPVGVIRYDRNIEGPRGRFPHGAWAASARYCCDTLVGAVAHPPGDAGLYALMAVTAEIPYWEPEGPHSRNGRMHLCIPPQGSRGEARIESDHAVFEATYRMACMRTVFGKPAFPTLWQCSQHWRLDSGRMEGILRVTAEQDQTARPPALRIRFGIDGVLETLDADTYRYGPFQLRLQAEDFGFRRVVKAPVMLSVLENHAAELLARSASDLKERRYRAGQAFTARITVSSAGALGSAGQPPLRP